MLVGQLGIEQSWYRSHVFAESHVFVSAGSGDMGFSLKSVQDSNSVGVTSRYPITSVDSYFYPEEDVSAQGEGGIRPKRQSPGRWCVTPPAVSQLTPWISCEAHGASHSIQFSREDFLSLLMSSWLCILLQNLCWLQLLTPYGATCVIS